MVRKLARSGGKLASPRLANLSRRYVWWLPPAEVARDPDRLIRQVLSLGLPEDYLFLLDHFGRERIIQALRSAPAGAIDPRSWTFWHRQFGLAVPPLPQRSFGAES